MLKKLDTEIHIGVKSNLTIYLEKIWSDLGLYSENP